MDQNDSLEHFATARMTRKKLENIYNSCPKMILLEKWKILTPLQKFPINIGHLGIIIITTVFEKLLKVQ